MEQVIRTWLAHTPPLGDASTRTALGELVDVWQKVQPVVLLENAVRVEPYMEAMPAEWKAEYTAALTAMEQAWKEMRQAIVDKHITVYERKDRVVGYTFAGFGVVDKTEMKWILCGTERFTEDYMNMQTEEEMKTFNKRYQKLDERVPFPEVDALDTKHSDHRYQRVLKLSAPKHDSGWVKI